MTQKLNRNQLQSLREEFIDFKINEMTNKELLDYASNQMLQDVMNLNQDELENEINTYDDFLYDILVPYVKDEENSYEILQEFIHERHENDWIDDV